MDLYIDRDEFSRGLARVQNVIERRSTQPVLSHVLLCARSGGEGKPGLRITATDTEIAYIGDLDANVERPGELAVEAANLFQVIRTLPESTVRLTEGSKNRLEIQSGRAFFKIPGLSADEYPALPAFDAKEKALLPEGALRRMVEQTSFSVAQDDSRYGLNGAHLERRDDLLRVVATDGHRLSAAEAPYEGQLAIAPRMLVPRKALSVMRKLLEATEENIELSFGESAVRLTRAGQVFWFRLLDGEFPDYQAVVPTEGRHRVLLHRPTLASTLKRVAILVQERARAVRFAFSDSELEIQVENIDRGEVKETIPVELEGEAITVGFNVRYLQDIIGVMTGDHLQLEMAHPLGPCLVRDPDELSAFYVVMPMRLD